MLVKRYKRSNVHSQSSLKLARFFTCDSNEFFDNIQDINVISVSSAKYFIYFSSSLIFSHSIIVKNQMRFKNLMKIARPGKFPEIKKCLCYSVFFYYVYIQVALAKIWTLKRENTFFIR